MARSSFTIKGDKEMVARLQRLAVEQREKMHRALYRLAEGIMANSKARFVPVRDSALKNSGFVEMPVTVGFVTSVTLKYGGPAAPYALAIHEHPSEHSPESWKRAEASGNPVQFRPPGRGPKFLEKPIMEKIPTAAADLARDMKL
jgi:hypothetical protein